MSLWTHRATATAAVAATRRFCASPPTRGIHWKSGTTTHQRRQVLQRRQMGGGGHYLEISERHTMMGEVFGVACWLWIFYRARQDLPVVLGYRHAWEHAGGDHHDDDAHDDDHHPSSSRHEQWDKFSTKAMQQVETDDDDEEEDEDDE